MTMRMQVFVDWDHASMRDFANRVFKLNSRVDNPKPLVQARSHVLQNPFAY